MVAPPTRVGTGEDAELTSRAPAVRPATRGEDAQPPAPRTRPAERPTVPDRAGEDTDEAWGELPPGSDDARLLADKPPHWQ